jgi:TnpA family transposase
MPDESKSAHHGRLHILTNDEIQNIFYLPTFTDEERFSYFSLTQSEFEILDQLRSLPSKLNFILQLGYFKERRQFFNFEFADVSADVEFICRKYFPQDQIEIQNLPKIAVNTILKHRRTIAALHQFRFCRSARERKAIEQTARNAARISAKPIYIFREILAFLENQRIILPGYSFLQDTISMALNYEEQRLQILLQQKLTILETKQLDELLSDSGGLYEITNLKREARDFSLGEIRREIERGIKIRELYQAAKEILPLLEISNQSIAHYASLVAYYRVDKLKRFDTWRTYLYLLCFIHQRYGRLHDILINCLLYRVRQYTDQAKLFAIEKLSSINLTTNQTLVKAAACLRVLTDEEIPPETPFGIVRQRAFKILDKDAINQFTDHILQDNQFDEPEFRWELVEKIAAQFKLNLRPLLINVEFSGVAETSELLKAIDFLRNVFRREQSLSAVNPKRFPVGFIPESQFRYFYENDKTSGKKRIRSRRYEFFVYQSLANALSAGDINCRDSLKFRSFEDDLIDDETWRQKNSLIRQANLPILSEPVEFILEELEIRLEERLREVNRRIADRENESFHQTEKGKRWSLKYPVPSDTHSDSLFDSIPQIDLYQVIRFAARQTDFIGAFSHLRGKYVKQKADLMVIAACLMAWGTNTGLGRMSKISDLKADVLQTASDNFIRPETLHEANQRIVDEIARFDLFHEYNISEKVHSSSDGQKFETRFHTINSRYSPKYFGLKKGIVAYTLVANHIPVNARIIGANEHESHFVFDVLFNNTTKIQPEIHSTDTHGTNQVNFALLNIFGYQFAPRFKDIYDTVSKSLYGFKHPSRYPDYRIKPIRKINRKLIIQEWDNITRIILSLANKATTQHIITRKLSSYSRTNQTKQALWEYDNIIRSLYLLDYIDSPPLRQHVQQALNRGENYHQLKRAVSFANFGKLRFKSEYEQTIWNECSRLLTNCILYYNLTLLTELIREKEKSDLGEEAEIIKQISPTAWQHVNFMGRYDFTKAAEEINISEIIKEIKFIPLSQPQIPY